MKTFGPDAEAGERPERESARATLCQRGASDIDRDQLLEHRAASVERRERLGAQPAVKRGVAPHAIGNRESELVRPAEYARGQAAAQRVAQCPFRVAVLQLQSTAQAETELFDFVVDEY